MEREAKKIAQKKKATANNFELRKITPLTNNQQAFFVEYTDNQVISLTGSAGTGKTFLALFKALEQLEKDPYIHSIKIIRSTVSSRDMGFLPGDVEEKLSSYESPYISIVNELYGRDDAYNILKSKKLITFEPSSFLRGMTFNNTIVIVDEAQNMSHNELFTIITRFGQDCKMILCGDVAQDDLTSVRYNEQSGYGKILRVLDTMNLVGSVIFGHSDIVRSSFVKEFIIACENEESDVPLPKSILNG